MRNGRAFSLFSNGLDFFRSAQSHASPGALANQLHRDAALAGKSLSKLVAGKFHPRRPSAQVSAKLQDLAPLPDDFAALDRAIAPGYLIAYSIDCIIATIDLTSLGNRHMLKSMWDQNSTNQPTVFRLSQKAGPVVEQVLRRSERDWPLTLEDCQAALTRLLPQLRLNRAGYGDYWRWVGRTRAEMTRLYAAQLQSCRARQSWDLAALVRLRWCLESVTVRLYCAPWLSGRAESPVLGLSQFNRLSA